MKTRDVYVTKAQTLTDSGSTTFDLSALGKVQHLRVKFGATTGATSDTVGKLKHLVSKIEVVDGSNVLASCSGLQWFAIDCFCNRVAPFHDLAGGVSIVITDELVVLFGRFMGDREVYADFSMVKKPLLRVTWAFPVSATVGIATGTATISVIARTIEDAAPPYQGFIMRKEIFSWTTAASGDQQVPLPLDYPYMGLYVGALKTTIVPDTIITNIKLTRNIDQFIDYSLTGTDAFAKNYEDYGLFKQKFRPLVDTAATWLGDLYYKTGAYFSKPGATAKSITTAVTAESVATVATTGGSADATELTLEGVGPAAEVYLPCYQPSVYFEPQVADFLQVAGINDLRLILTQGVTAAAGTVVVEQLHP